jgi:choline kinase
LCSLWLARRVLQQGFVVMNRDVLFHPAMLVDLLAARHQNALLVAYPQSGDPEMGHEDTRMAVGA